MIEEEAPWPCPGTDKCKGHYINCEHCTRSDLYEEPSDCWDPKEEVKK